MGIPLGYKVAGAAILVLLVGGYIGWLKLEIADLEVENAKVTSERDEARGAAARNLAEVVRVTEAKASAEQRAAAADIRVAAADRRRADQVKTIIREVHNAPETNACPAMPGPLVAALDGVRRAREAAAAARGPR